MKQLHFDGRLVYGYVDTGPEELGFKQGIASEVLVYLFQPVNKKWKLPLGYFLVTEVTWIFVDMYVWYFFFYFLM